MRTYSPNPWINLAIYYNLPKNKVTPTLWKNIKKHTTGGCWIWTGGVTNWGYPRLWNKSPHRIIYIEYHGPIPDNHVIATKCRKKLCVHPKHLYALPRKKVYITLSRNNFRAEMTRQGKCSKGHDLTPDNTVVFKNGPNAGKVRCKTCQHETSRRHRQKRKLRERSSDQRLET